MYLADEGAKHRKRPALQTPRIKIETGGKDQLNRGAGSRDQAYR